jgi:late competence protein required for DNA uptake (superfamily II DNA/RNA helicase)
MEQKIVCASCGNLWSVSEAVLICAGAVQAMYCRSCGVRVERALVARAAENPPVTKQFWTPERIAVLDHLVKSGA